MRKNFNAHVAGMKGHSWINSALWVIGAFQLPCLGQRAGEASLLIQCVFFYAFC